MGCQAELDSQMTVRLLPLSAQGLPESYGMDSTFETPSYNFENAPYPQK